MIAALLDGARRVTRAPLLVAGVYLAAALTVIPLGLAVADAVEPRLESSGDAVHVASRVDQTWWEAFQEPSRGVARTLQPRVAGVATVVMNLKELLDTQPLDSSVVMTVVAYLVAWAFLVGGLLDRLARQRRVGSGGFLAACGAYFFRFCRLTVLAAAVYAVLFTVSSWLVGDLYALATRDVTSTSATVALQVGLHVAFGALLLAVNLVVEYAMVRAVVEDRRSVVGAVLASIRFVRRRPVDVTGLYLLNGLVYLLVLGGYAGVTAGFATDGSLWHGVLITQAYVVARLFATLVLFASHTAYFQSQLAHATYVASPPPRWPMTGAR